VHLDGFNAALIFYALALCAVGWLCRMTAG